LPAASRPSSRSSCQTLGAMKYLLARVTAVALAAALCGCDLDVPAISSASYVVYAGGSPGRQTGLTAAQVEALSDWLSKHRSGWSRSVVTYVPRTLISIRHGDGETSTLDLWPTALHVYGTFGQYQRSLSEVEAHELHGILRRNGT
jgi:hypothetical protein